MGSDAQVSERGLEGGVYNRSRFLRSYWERACPQPEGRGRRGLGQECVCV